MLFDDFLHKYHDARTKIIDLQLAVEDSSNLNGQIPQDQVAKKVTCQAPMRDLQLSQSQNLSSFARSNCKLHTQSQRCRKRSQSSRRYVRLSITHDRLFELM